MLLSERPRLLRRQRRVYPNHEIAVRRYIENNPGMKESSG